MLEEQKSHNKISCNDLTLHTNHTALLISEMLCSGRRFNGACHYDTENAKVFKHPGNCLSFHAPFIPQPLHARFHFTVEIEREKCIMTGVMLHLHLHLLGRSVPRAKLRQHIFVTQAEVWAKNWAKYSGHFRASFAAQNDPQIFSQNSSQFITPCLVAEIMKFHLRELLGLGGRNTCKRPLHSQSV